MHAPRERLKRKTLTLHHAIVSLIEELEATDWYQQRADDCEDEALSEILLHNMREEMEHASMVLEWMRRNSADWDSMLRTYLFTDAPITEIEEEDTAGGGGEGGSGDAPTAGFTIGTLKKNG
ncbi:MAG: ferritin [Rhodospirillaceae bacterium]|nr:ferritin [Rhodospirillaceae bacterium]